MGTNEEEFDITNEEQRGEQITLIRTRASLLTKAYKRGLATPPQIEQLLKDKEELERLLRVERCSKNVLEFMYEYFSEDLNPGNDGNLIPSGVSPSSAPTFHHELCSLLNETTSERMNNRVCWAAPRGHAKSAYLSNAFPVHQIVYLKRNFILILSETDDAAKMFIDWVSGELKFNNKLRGDFGEHLSTRKAMNNKDNQSEFKTLSGVKVESSSMGKQLRGKRNGPHRPDLVILDDVESSKNTNTSELREKNHDWFNKSVIPIGDPDKTAFVYMGTMIHSDGLLNSVLRRPDFKRKKFAAILARPEREDLWGEYESIIRGLMQTTQTKFDEEEDLENALKPAFDFYHINQEEMDKGVQVLWPARWAYHKLIVEKITMGSKAFNSEYMNNPIDEETQIFKPHMFMPFVTYKELADLKLDYYMAWDIAMGKNNRSDYNAIIVIGRCKKTGILYVVDAWAKKIPAHEAIDELMKKVHQYRPKVLAIETVAAQFDFYRQVRERLPKEGIYGVKLKAVQSRTKKEERIESMEPLFENHMIRLMEHQHLLHEQLEMFPTGTNDDLPDALQMAVDLCAKSKRRTFAHKPRGL